MKRILKSELDKFYTKESLSKKLINYTDLSKYDYVIDPCCGDGSFFNNIEHPNKIGIDILPQCPNVITQDFLTWDSSSLKGNIITISNPPFGKQGSLALKFINKAAEYSNTIAFILPLSFAKSSMKNKIPLNFHLEYEEILEPNSFLLDGDDYDVKCVYQIWVKKGFNRVLSRKEQEVGWYYTKDKNIADLSVRRVGVYAGKTMIDCDKSEQSHYFIVLEDKTKIGLVLEKLNDNKWVDLTVGPRSISKEELNPIINKIIN